MKLGIAATVFLGLACAAACSSALAPSPPVVPPQSALAATTDDGPFRLELEVPTMVWHADDPISGTATLSYNGSSPTLIAASGQGVILFEYDQIGGAQHPPTYALSAGFKNYTGDAAKPPQDHVRKLAQPKRVDAHL